MSLPELKQALEKVDSEILTAALKEDLICNAQNPDAEIGRVIGKICLMCSLGIPQEITIIENWFRKYYGAFTPSEILLAFELNMRSEIGEKIQHYQLMNIDFVSSVMNKYQEHKRKAWATYNRHKPSEEKQIEALSNRMESLIKFIETENKLPDAWDWSVVFDQMGQAKIREPNDVLDKWKVLEERNIKSEINRLIHTSTNIFERNALEIRLTDDAINSELRKRYVRKRITELYITVQK